MHLLDLEFHLFHHVGVVFLGDHLNTDEIALFFELCLQPVYPSLQLQLLLLHFLHTVLLHFVTENSLFQRLIHLRHFSVFLPDLLYSFSENSLVRFQFTYPLQELLDLSLVPVLYSSQRRCLAFNELLKLVFNIRVLGVVRRAQLLLSRRWRLGLRIDQP